MDHSNHPHNNLLSQPIPIAYLPLRRGTAELLRGCGFHTVKEVYDTVVKQHQQHQRNGSNGSDCDIDIMKLVMELRQFRRNKNMINVQGGLCESDSTTGIDTSTTTAEEMTHAQHVYEELIEAVTLVTQDDATTELYKPNPNGVRSTYAPPTTGKTAADLLRLHHNVIGNSTTNTNIITFCRSLDELLDGGIAIGELTELAGSPGSGKTTMCLQLAVNAALPYYCGGVQGRTIYIDTEGSFAPERCYDLATQLIQHVQTGFRRKHRQQSSVNQSKGGHANGTPTNVQTQHQWNVTAEEILNNILVYRVHDVADLSAIVHGALPAILSSQGKHDLPIRLIIVDSIAFPYRAAASTTTSNNPSSTSLSLPSSATTMDYVTRTQQLTATAATLTSLSVQYRLAVVAVNQMTTKFATTTDHETMVNENDQNNANTEVCRNSIHTKTTLIPALGESWAHAVTSRLILNKPYSNMHEQAHHQYRMCSLTKSPRLPTGEAHFVITTAGIRGIEHVEATSKRSRRS